MKKLQQISFNPESRYRMTKPNKTPMPFIPKNERQMLGITNLLGQMGLKVIIESTSNKTKYNQCRNWQRYGHGQSVHSPTKVPKMRKKQRQHCLLRETEIWNMGCGQHLAILKKKDSSNLEVQVQQDKTKQDYVN